MRTPDVAQYLTWFNAGRSELLLRNYHAPWQTEPAMWQPVMVAAARTGLPAVAAYNVLHAALYLLAAWALLFSASVFCPGRQKWYALAFAACAIPLQLLGWIPASLLQSPRLAALTVTGLLSYGYDTADGLFRGGISSSPVITIGTLCVLCAMALLTRYLETSKLCYLMGLCGVAFLSALLHPFEIFVIVAASTVPLLLHRRIMAWIALGISAGVGMLPYIVTAARTEWVRDASETLHTSLHPFWLLANFGIPCFLTVYLLLLRFRMPAIGDTVLRSWFFSLPVLLLIPGIPFPLHLQDGFAYCIGFLLVRRIACDPQLRSALEKHRNVARAGFGALLGMSAVALALFYVQVWQDGRRADPQLLINAVRPIPERALLDWLERNTARDTLVLAPEDVAPWIATIPRPSFASHDFCGITFAQQREQAERFYQRAPGSESILAEYGMGAVVARRDSKTKPDLPQAVLRTEIGPWLVYEFPDARMHPYPGLTALDGRTSFSLSHKLFAWLGR
jgi:hypothetical protein